MQWTSPAAFAVERWKSNSTNNGSGTDKAAVSVAGARWRGIVASADRVNKFVSHTPILVLIAAPEFRPSLLAKIQSPAKKNSVDQFSPSSSKDFLAVATLIFSLGHVYSNKYKRNADKNWAKA